LSYCFNFFYRDQLLCCFVSKLCCMVFHFVVYSFLWDWLHTWSMVLWCWGSRTNQLRWQPWSVFNFFFYRCCCLGVYTFVVVCIYCVMFDLFFYLPCCYFLPCSCKYCCVDAEWLL
jgi:hypothetical protein